MLALPLKQTTSMDTAKPMLNYIEKNYSKQEKKDLEAPVKDFDALRKNVYTSKIGNDKTLNVLLEYYQQLLVVERHFPISEAIIKISFTWKDSFVPKKQAAQSNINLEKASIQWNLACSYAEIAVSHGTHNDDALKKASHFFQLAAGTFRFMISNTSKHLLQPLTPDLAIESLTMAENLMLAQAQECFFLKAQADKKKPLILSKLAAQVAEYYAEALRCASQNNFAKHIEKEHIFSTCNVKGVFFKAVAQFELAKAVKEAEKYGEEVARLSLTQQLVGEARRLSRGHMKEKIEDLSRLVVKQLAVAVEENDKIYCDPVPQLGSLDDPSGAAMVKPNVPGALEAEPAEDPFMNLVPLKVHNAVSEYNEDVAKLISDTSSKISLAGDEKMAVLQSLDLPDSLDSLKKKPKDIPPNILQQLETCRMRGGLKMLQDNTRQLANMKKVTEEILANSEATIFSKEPQLGANSSLLQSLKQEAAKYRENLSRAVAADGFIEKKMAEKSAILTTLDMSKKEIEAQMPKAIDMDSGVQSLIKEQKDALSAWDDNVKAREKLLEKLISTKSSDNIISKLASNDAYQVVLESEKQKYQELIHQIDAHLNDQERISKAIADRSAALEKSIHENSTLNQREEVIRRLQAAATEFSELMHYMGEGLTFYTNLQEILSEFSSRVAAAGSGSTPAPPPSQAAAPPQGPYGSIPSITPTVGGMPQQYQSAGYGAPQAFGQNASPSAPPQ